MPTKEEQLIIALRARTEKLDRDLNRAKKRIKGFQSSANKVAAGIRTAMLQAFGGAAILEGIRRAVGSLADFEFAMDKVAAISGATAKDLEDLKDNARELGRTTKFTATEIAGLQLELSKLGFSPARILASTDAIRKLATVADEELSESAKTLAGTLKSFNLEATESDRVANVMAESFSKSALTLEKFTVATANSGAIANSLGITLEQNTARLGALVDANIDASKAGTDLRKIYVELNNKGIEYNTALDMVANSSDKVATATRLVGIRAAGALTILASQRGKVNELTQTLGDSNHELNSMVGIMEDNLITDWQKFTSAIDGLIQKAEKAAPALRKLVQLATEFVQRAGEDIIDTKVRETLEAATQEAAKFGTSIGNAQRMLEFYKPSLDKARAALTEYEMKLRLEGKRLNKNTRAYEKLLLPFVKYKTLVDAANKVIEDNNKNLETQNELLRKQEAAAKAAAVQQAKLNQIAQAGMMSRTIEGAGFQSIGQAPIIEPGITEANINEFTGRVSEAIGQFRVRIHSDILGVNQMLEAMTIDLIAGIAEALGSGQGIKGAFDVIANIFADGLIRLGKALIAYGVLMKASQAALKNPFGSIGSFGAIAAGAAAIAAGAALRKAVADSNSTSLASGGGGGGSGAGQGTFSQQRAGKTKDIIAETRISGRDILLVVKREEEFQTRTFGG